MNETQIIGPDPARLTDSEIMDVATRLMALGQRVAGQPGRKVTSADRVEIDPGNLWLFEGLETLYSLLLLENERRLRADDAALIAEIEAWRAAEDPPE